MKEAITNLRGEAEVKFLDWNSRDKSVVGVSQIADSYRDLLLACNSALDAIASEPAVVELLKAKAEASQPTA